jgi:hypothetical protein
LTAVGKDYLVLLLIAFATCIGSSAAERCNEVTVPAGLPITCRLRETVSSERATVGESFGCDAVRDTHVVATGPVVIPKDAVFFFKLVGTKMAGRFWGVSNMDFALTAAYFPDGRMYGIHGLITDVREGSSNGVKPKSGGRIVATHGFPLFAPLPMRGKPVILRVEGVISVKLFDDITVMQCQEEEEVAHAVR